MSRLLVIVPVIVLAAMIFALVDLLRIEESRVRAFPKPLWIVVIVLLPLIGAILWFVLGRDRGDRPRSVSRPAPDDDPAFLGRINRETERDAQLREQEQRIKKLEQELAALDDDDPRDS